MALLASKPASPRKCPVLSSRTALFFDLLRMGQGFDQFCFVLKNAIELVKKFYQEVSFLEESLKFTENLRNLGAKTFFFGDHFRIVSLLVWPWSRAFLSLSSRRSVLGRAVLGLGFF